MSHGTRLEDRLIEALQPIRSFALAANLYHLFQTGLFDSLCACDSTTVSELAKKHGMDEFRLSTFLRYLSNEGYVTESEQAFSLTAKGRGLEEFRGWYTLMIGGYAETFLQMGDKLRVGAGNATRNAERVGVGSCAMSHYDAIPLTRRLMGHMSRGCRRLLDLGCGNALYLVEFCRMSPEIEEAWGVEPDRAGYESAVKLVRESGYDKRIHLYCDSALGFLDSGVPAAPDFTVLGFVLHEVLGQSGEEAVVGFLRRLVDRFPDLHIAVIEVDWQITNPTIMRHGLSLAYYNPYYLLHPFTGQRLETLPFWEQVFAKAGLEIVAKETTSPDVDSTRLEVGYLLRRAR
ncbi:2-ketoarginine methyltransferase [Archangium gephyra]|nr:2-ketoarginine methyltransferase [Archangium gephyra]